jgi:hypothetical protein
MSETLCSRLAETAVVATEAVSMVFLPAVPTRSAAAAAAAAAVLSLPLCLRAAGTAAVVAEAVITLISVVLLPPGLVSSPCLCDCLRYLLVAAPMLISIAA